ncbi:hypothetical protein [Fimbriiglobus ruber]|uniref:Uncharacterized protein n=1 Tax=Fimbriiglobus ruber TaxID=1908690 RepID=A0A225DS12_9BACT|nr:hypothetical protein [Fimbriiglobus ruber]OWK39949.1 hypothetical protein FRUB_05839 [Fimbriiglobus ruber]
MTIRSRLARIEQSARDRPPADVLHIISVVRTDQDPDRRPPGVYHYPSRTSVDLVHDGPEPDPVALRTLTDRLAPWGLVITCDAGEPISEILPDS